MVIAAVLLACAGCEDPVQVGPAVSPQGPDGPTPQQPQPQQAVGEPDAGEPALTYNDEVFVESEIQNRDPFRGFARIFKATPPETPQRRVTMPNSTIEEMTLIAIISGVAQPRAMLTDNSGIGHVVKRGDYVGRAEIIQTGGADALPITLNWRVDRIRPGEVILVREDPTAPGRPPLTRVIPLYPEGEELGLIAVSQSSDARPGGGGGGDGIDGPDRPGVLRGGVRPGNVRRAVNQSVQYDRAQTERAIQRDQTP